MTFGGDGFGHFGTAGLDPRVKAGAVASITGVEKVAAITPTALTVP